MKEVSDQRAFFHDSIDQLQGKLDTYSKYVVSQKHHDKDRSDIESKKSLKKPRRTTLKSQNKDLTSVSGYSKSSSPNKNRSVKGYWTNNLQK